MRCFENNTESPIALEEPMLDPSCLFVLSAENETYHLKLCVIQKPVFFGHLSLAVRIRRIPRFDDARKQFCVVPHLIHLASNAQWRNLHSLLR